MFILYAFPIGLLLGLLLGGRPSGLTGLQFRHARLAIAGLLVQVVLFSGPVAERVGDFGPPIYVASTAVVLVAVLANVRATRGLVLVAAGAGTNLLAIVANRGYMPASSEAIAALGREASPGYSNSLHADGAVLQPLGDVFAMPAWLPFANVYSVGDVLIGVGVAVVIAQAMRAERGVSPPAAVLQA